MTGAIVDVVSGLLVLAGAAFFLIGAVGFVRMPDLFTRIHAASLADTTGMALILIGLAIHAGPSFPAAKLVVLALFLLFMGPAATHALAAAALAAGVKPIVAAARGKKAPSAGAPARKAGAPARKAAPSGRKRR